MGNKTGFLPVFLRDTFQQIGRDTDDMPGPAHRPFLQQVIFYKKEPALLQFRVYGNARQNMKGDSETILLQEKSTIVIEGMDSIVMFRDTPACQGNAHPSQKERVLFRSLDRDDVDPVLIGIPRPLISPGDECYLVLPGGMDDHPLETAVLGMMRVIGPMMR
jgi:hypothetical protein